MARLGQLIDELLYELSRFEPGLFSGADCAGLVASFARAEKALAGARARAALRAAECGAHRDQGFADASEWLARQTGTSARSARTELETAKALDACSRTREALTAGELSLAQATEIVRTVADAPDAEEGLLALTKTAALGRLCEEGRRQRTQAIPAEELYARQRAARQVIHWRDELGMVCGRFRLTPDVGVPFVNRLDRHTNRRRRVAKRTGTADPWEAHAADAFIAMFERAGGRTPPMKSRSVDLVIVCNVHAWRRGHVHPGEECHLLGGGPVPVALAKKLATDAFVKAVLHDGVQIHTVAHFGRRLPAALRTALVLGPLPELDGITCVEEGCDRRYGLEWDHVDPIANGGVASYANLQPRCKAHHWEKTGRDRDAGLLLPRSGAARRDRHREEAPDHPKCADQCADGCALRRS